MAPLTQIRRLRSLPRALLAVILLTVAQTAWVPCAMSDTVMDTVMMGSMSTMDDHCAYCPPDSTIDVNACVFPHAPTVDVAAASAHHVDVLLASPLLQPATFDSTALRTSRSFMPLDFAAPVPSRPLILTHCVQLK